MFWIDLLIPNRRGGGFGPSSCERMQPAEAGLFEEILNMGSSMRIRVTGGSMAPFLRDGEIVNIRKVPHLSLRIGDLIFFKDSQGGAVLHRIMEKRAEDGDTIYFRTKGDAMIAYDDPIPGMNVLGKICRIERTDSGGQSRDIDLESSRWRMINATIFLIQRVRSAFYYRLFLPFKNVQGGY